MLPLGLDTLAVSLSLGIKSASVADAQEEGTRPALPHWLRSALLFSTAETLMPLVGLLVGYTASLAVSSIMHYVGALLLISLGAWEVWNEGHEYLVKIFCRLPSLPKEQTNREINWQRRATQASPPAIISSPAPTGRSASQRFAWGGQLLLALSVSMDELAVGFSLGTLPLGKAIGPLTLCLYVGIQGFVMAVLGITLGRAIRARLKPLKEVSELIGAFLLIGLGIWVLFFS